MTVDISIVVAAYNAALFLERSVGSALKQSFSNIEVLIIDDRSTDDTYSVAQKLAAEDDRIRVFQLESNQGPSAARNKGLDEAKGKWVSILDADDAYEPERLNKLFNVATAGSFDFIADNHLFYDVHSKVIGGKAFSWGREPTLPLTLEGFLLGDRVGIGAPLGWIKPMIRRDFIEKHGLRYQQDLRYGEDFFLYAEMLLHGAKAVLLNEPLYIYTTRRGKVSRQKSDLSQTSVSMSGVVDGCHRFLKQYGNRLSKREIRLMRKRISSCFAFDATRQIQYALSERHVGQAVLIGMRCPTFLLFVLRYAGYKIMLRLN